MRNTGEFIHEAPRCIPVAEKVDVCVIGGSCTGVFAAVRAAEAGMRVAIVENNGFFGGTASAGLVPVWHSRFDTEGRREIIRGLTHQVLEHLVAHGEAIVKEPSNASVYAYLNTASLTVALDELVAWHPAIRPFLHARFVGVAESAPRHPTHAVIEDKSGRRAIEASFFIDATGDADFLDRAGFETWSLPAAQLQPHTTCAMISGVPAVRAAHPDFSISEMMRPCRGAGLKHVFGWTAPVIGAPELLFAAVTRVQNCNPVDADDLTAGEVEGRRQITSLVRAANREFFTEDAEIRIAALASSMGLRESRHRAACIRSPRPRSCRARPSTTPRPTAAIAWTSTTTRASPSAISTGSRRSCAWIAPPGRSRGSAGGGARRWASRPHSTRSRIAASCRAARTTCCARDGCSIATAARTARAA